MHKRTQPSTRLTALDGVGRRLQGDDPAAGLGDVHPEHEPHPRVLPADVRLALAQLDVGVAEFQDPRTVDAAGRWTAPFIRDPLNEQDRSATDPAWAAGSHRGTPQYAEVA